MQYDFIATHRSWLEKAFFTKDKKQSWQEWQNRYEKVDSEQKFDHFGFTPKLSDLEYLPSLSFMLRILFKLRKPYLSKDDHTFHLLDNPVRKDKVFQTPMVGSTSWKGALQATLWQLGHQENDEQIIRLFGNEREEEDHKKLKSGCLYFYPTFFDKIGLEVINPHDRKKGTSAWGPIYIECVPKDATGELVIAYVPFGQIEENQVAQDLELVAKGVEAMLTVYGFGAKTSSGFGIAEQKSTGQIAINYPDEQQILQRPKEPEYLENLRLFLEQHPNEDFQLSPNEWRKLHQASQSQRKSYQEVRNARSTYQDRLKTYESELANWETEANAPPSPQTIKDFSTIVELVSKAQAIAQKLRAE